MDAGRQAGGQVMGVEGGHWQAGGRVMGVEGGHWQAGGQWRCE